MSSILLLIVPLLPLLLAALCLDPRTAQQAMHAAPLAAAPAFAALLIGDMEAPVPGLLLDARMRLDDIARVFLGFTALLWAAASVYARTQMREDGHRARFFSFFFAAMAGNFGLILAGDALGFYLWFSLMSFAAYGLVVHEGSAQATRAGRAYLVLAVLGELLLFAGLVLHAGRTGVTDFAAMAETPVTPITALLLLAGFGIKAGTVPLHMWLPLAHPAAPVPASAVLSGAMIKAGLLGWLRFLPLEQGLPGNWGTGVAALGLAAALLGVLLGLPQTRAKTVLAYSSVSQMGFMLIAVGTAWQYPHIAPGMTAVVLLYALHHGLAKGALFLGVGVAHASDQRRVTLWALLALPGLALAGLPLLSGAGAKYALKSQLTEAPGLDWLSVVPLAATGTALLVARYLWLLRESTPAATRAPAGMRLPWLTLVVAGPVLVWTLPTARDASLAALSPAALATALWPLGLAVALAFWAVHRPCIWRPRIPEGDLWLLFEHAGAVTRRLRPPHIALPALQATLASRSTQAFRVLQGLETRLAKEPLPGAILAVLGLLMFWLLSSS